MLFEWVPAYISLGGIFWAQFWDCELLQENRGVFFGGWALVGDLLTTLPQRTRVGRPLRGMDTWSRNIVHIPPW